MVLRIPKIIIIYISIGVLLSAIILFLSYILFGQSQETTVSQRPAPTPISLEKPINNSQIREEAVEPKEDSTGQTIKNPSQKVIFQFSEDISPDDITVYVTPQIPVKFEQGGEQNQISVFPDPPAFWAPDVLYLVRIYDNESRLITSYYIKVPRFDVPYDPL